MAEIECDLHRVHHPSVAKLHLISVDGQEIGLCGTGLDNLRICVDYMRGDGPSPAARIGKETWDLAQQVIAANKVWGI